MVLPWWRGQLGLKNACSTGVQGTYSPEFLWSSQESAASKRKPFPLKMSTSNMGKETATRRKGQVKELSQKRS